MKQIIEYKSRDGYFDIIEKLLEDTHCVEVTHLFSTVIDGIEGFKTVCLYNMSGQLIKYSNSYGTIIEHKDKPITVITKPRMFQA
jgi:hypothetical protein